MSFVFRFSILFTLIALYITYRVALSQRVRRKAERHGCQPAPHYKHKDPIFGLDIFLRTGDAITNNRFLDVHQSRYNTYGHTFEALNFGSRAIYSVHPENVKAVWSKNAADWGIQPFRLDPMRAFCGEGFITTDGVAWKLSHDLLKPGFHKSIISDFTALESHFQLLLQHIPKDGSKFDLQPWLLKLYLDMNTLFLFGEPIGILSGSAPPHAKGFLEAFQEGFNGCGMRIALGPLKFLWPTRAWLRACAKVHSFADVYVDRALEYRQELLAKQAESATMKQRTLLFNMAQETDDHIVLRNQIVQALMAATETTASLISSIFHVLSNHTDVFATLQKEVGEVGDEALTFERLSGMQYLQEVIKETLRLYPVFPQNNRVALKDTILPIGGGPDHTSPIFAPRGTLFDTCFATIHRDKETWGPDADEFRPSRWQDGFTPAAFTYMPFGAGPRQCLAQQKATMEASYITVRMLQQFKEIKSEDDRPWQGQVALTAKNANGCWISLVSGDS